MALLAFITLSFIAIITYYIPIRDKKSGILLFILSFTLFISIFSQITYFNDQYNYEYVFDNIESYDTDLVFTYLVKKAHEFGFEFKHVYLIHIILMGLFSTLFISQFTNKTLIIILLISLFRYVDFANQIRYYLGFFIGIFSLYLIIVPKKYLWGIPLAIISVLSHSSLIILYVIPIFHKLFLRLRKKYLLLINIALLIFIESGTKVISQLFPHLVKYFENPDLKSSLLGGFFDSISAIVMLILVLANHNFLIRKKNQLLNDTNYKFLYALSIYSFLFISSGFIFRIIMDRFVFSFSLIWLCTLIYSLKAYSRYSSQKSLIFFGTLFMIFWFYYAPDLLLGSSFYLKEALMMLGFN